MRKTMMALALAVLLAAPAIAQDTKAYVFGAGMRVFDPETRTLLDQLSIPGGGQYGQAVILGDKLFVALLRLDNEVAVIDTKTNTMIERVPVGLTPIGMGLTPDGSKLYVGNFGADTVSILDTDTHAVSRNHRGGP